MSEIYLYKLAISKIRHETKFPILRFKEQITRKQFRNEQPRTERVLQSCNPMSSTASRKLVHSVIYLSFVSFLSDFLLGSL